MATAQLYPDINLTAAISQDRAHRRHARRAGEQCVEHRRRHLAVPLFHGGALQAQKREAEDEFTASAANYQQTVLHSFAQVADVLDALQSDADLLGAQSARAPIRPILARPHAEIL